MLLFEYQMYYVYILDQHLNRVGDAGVFKVISDDNITVSIPR